LSQCPTDSVALRLVVQAVTLVLVLGATGARIDAVLSLEVLGKLINIDRLDVTADRVLHLDPVTRILECDPLYAILILPYYKRSRCGNGTRCSIGVDVGTTRRASVHVGGTNRRTLRWGLGRTEA